MSSGLFILSLNNRYEKHVNAFLISRTTTLQTLEIKGLHIKRVMSN